MNKKVLIIMCCENGEKISSQFKKEIIKNYKFNEKFIYFVDVMVDRIVPDQEMNNLDIEVEKYYSWIVDTNQWPKEIEKLDALTYSKNIDAEICKKVWLLNGGHASLSWASYRLNKFNSPFTYESLKIKELKSFLLSYLEEVGLIFSNYFNYDILEVKKIINEILKRFENPYIKDNLERVGRNLYLKLQLNERILKPLFIGLCLNLKTLNIRKSILNVIEYLNPNDLDGKKLVEMQKKII
nr:hypothetical protein [Spiroplasma taiwanense]